MNRLGMLAAAACLAASVATGAVAAPGDDPYVPPKDGNTVCLWTYKIDHTHYIAPRTLLFYMRGGQVWQNSLQNDCRGLDFNGFAYVTHDGEICSNMQSIMVLRTHEVCLLGAFTPYTPVSAPPAH